jgi:hypothetical protein
VNFFRFAANSTLDTGRFNQFQVPLLKRQFFGTVNASESAVFLKVFKLEPHS